MEVKEIKRHINNTLDISPYYNYLINCMLQDSSIAILCMHFFNSTALLYIHLKAYLCLAPIAKQYNDSTLQYYYNNSSIFIRRYAELSRRLSKMFGDEFRPSTARNYLHVELATLTITALVVYK